MLPLIHWSDLFIRQEVVWDPKDMEDGAGDGASSSHRFLHLSCFFSSNPKHTEKPCALGFSVRVGLKHTLRCVIWVKSWKLEALIWAGSAVNFVRATDLFVYNISLRPGAEAASEEEQPGLVDCTLYFVIRIGLFAYRVRLFFC